MKNPLTALFLFLVACCVASPAYSRNIEWEKVKEEADSLFNREDLSDSAIAVVEEGLMEMERALGPDNLDLAGGLSYLAGLYGYEENDAQAETLYRRSLSIREKALGPDDPGLAETQDHLAWYCNRQGKREEAESLYMRSLAIREKTFGPENPAVTTSLIAMAQFYSGQGLDAKAESLYKRSLSIDEKTFDLEGVAGDLAMLSALYRSQGKDALAESLYAQALRMENASFEPMHGTVNGLVVLRDLVGGGESYIDFQGSKAEKLRPCSCHTSYVGRSTSGKSTIDVTGDSEGWIEVRLGGKTYKNDQLVGDETVEVDKHEKKYEYTLVTFSKSIILTNANDERDKLELSPESVLVYCFRK